MRIISFSIQILFLLIPIIRNLLIKTMTILKTKFDLILLVATNCVKFWQKEEVSGIKKYKLY